MRYPANQPFRVTLGYGATSPRPYTPTNPHNGTDLVSDDRNIVAPEAGIVTYYANTNGNSGWMMVLSGNSGHRHTFSHTVPNSNRVPVGSRVTGGQQLATMGNTGLAYGVHVHWVVDSGKVNPESLITPGGDNMAANENFINNCATAVGRTTPPYNVKTGVWNDPAAKVWMGQPEDLVLQGWLSSPEGNTWFTKAHTSIKAVPILEARIEELEEQTDGTFIKVDQIYIKKEQ